MAAKAIVLGDKVRDKLTGLEGIAVCRTDWINGCVRVGIQPFGTHEGKPYEISMTDNEQIEKLEDKPIPTDRSKTGGPRPKVEASRN